MSRYEDQYEKKINNLCHKIFLCCKDYEWSEITIALMFLLEGQLEFMLKRVPDRLANSSVHTLISAEHDNLKTMLAMLIDYAKHKGTIQ